jgi:hypothetical protein
MILSDQEKKNEFRDNVIIAYFFVGTIAMALTAYFTLKQLSKNG